VRRVAIWTEGNIVALDPPRKLIDDLLTRGFTSRFLQQDANLEDVFLDLIGHEIATHELKNLRLFALLLAAVGASRTGLFFTHASRIS